MQFFSNERVFPQELATSFGLSFQQAESIIFGDSMDSPHKFYTGVGSRKTPKPILAVMKRFAEYLAEQGFTLRSGGARGADTSFEAGAGSKVIYTVDSFGGECASYQQCFEYVKKYHGAVNRLSSYGKKLQSRNSLQVLGNKLDNPSEFLVCWTPDGAVSHEQRSVRTGGTGQAISVASEAGIPVYNLARADHLALVKSRLEEGPSEGGSSLPSNATELIQHLVDTYNYRPLPKNLSNRVRAIYQEQLPQLDKEQPLVTKSGIKIAHGFKRVVVGDYGAYIEFTLEQINSRELIAKPGQEYRFSEDYRDSIKYFWLCPSRDHSVKIYWQRDTVQYADYKPGRLYISPDELVEGPSQGGSCAQPSNWFSNMKPFDEALVADGIKFRTPENFYQAMKSKDCKVRAKIADMNPYEAKRFTKDIEIRPDWNQIKVDVMKYALKFKFAKGTSWRKKLDSTDGKIVERNYWHDQFWGSCTCDTHKDIEGKNLLGKILMAIRDNEELASVSSSTSEENVSRWWELEKEEPEFHHPLYYVFNKFHYEEIHLEDDELPPDNAIATIENNEEKFFVRVDEDEGLLPQLVERSESERMIYESSDYYCSRDGKVYERHENRGWRDEDSDIGYIMSTCKVSREEAREMASMIRDISDSQFQRNYWKKQLITDWQRAAEEIKRLHLGLQLEDDGNDAMAFADYLDFEVYGEHQPDYEFTERVHTPKPSEEELTHEVTHLSGSTETIIVKQKEPEPMPVEPSYGWHQLKSWYQLEAKHEKEKQVRISKLHPFAKKVYERLVEVEELTKVMKAKLAKCMNRHEEVPVKDWIYIWSIWRQLESNRWS